MAKETTRIADAARRQHRDLHRIDHLRHQRQGRDSADMAAGLRAGGDDGIDAFTLHAPACSTVGITDTTLMPAAFKRCTTASPGSARPVVTMGMPSSMQVAAQRSVMPRPMGMMLTPNGLRGALPHAGDVGAQLLVGAAEGRKHAEPARLAHRRHQFDATAALHGALQDRVLLFPAGRR